MSAITANSFGQLQPTNWFGYGSSAPYTYNPFSTDPAFMGLALRFDSDPNDYIEGVMILHPPAGQFSPENEDHLGPPTSGIPMPTSGALPNSSIGVNPKNQLMTQLQNMLSQLVGLIQGDQGNGQGGVTNSHPNGNGSGRGGCHGGGHGNRYAYGGKFC